MDARLKHQQQQKRTPPQVRHSLKQMTNSIKTVDCFPFFKHEAASDEMADSSRAFFSQPDCLGLFPLDTTRWSWKDHKCGGWLCYHVKKKKKNKPIQSVTTDSLSHSTLEVSKLPRQNPTRSLKSYRKTVSFDAEQIGCNRMSFKCKNLDEEEQKLFHFWSDFVVETPVWLWMGVLHGTKLCCPTKSSELPDHLLSTEVLLSQGETQVPHLPSQRSKIALTWCSFSELQQGRPEIKTPAPTALTWKKHYFQQWLQQM